MPSITSPETMMTIAEAASFFRVHHSTMRRWINGHRISSHKVGKSVLISTKEAHRLLAESERPRRETLQ